MTRPPQPQDICGSYGDCDLVPVPVPVPAKLWFIWRLCSGSSHDNSTIFRHQDSVFKSNSKPNILAHLLGFFICDVDALGDQLSVRGFTTRDGSGLTGSLVTTSPTWSFSSFAPFK